MCVRVIIPLTSLAAASTGLVLGASLTRPEGPTKEGNINKMTSYKGGRLLPLGKTKVPFSLPVARALDSWVFCAAPISSLYLVSTYLMKRLECQYKTSP